MSLDLDAGGKGVGWDADNVVWEATDLVDPVPKSTSHGRCREGLTNRAGSSVLWGI